MNRSGHIDLRVRVRDMAKAQPFYAAFGARVPSRALW
jgi:hypothetical protein